MNRTMLLSTLVGLVLSLAVGTSQALAGAAAVNPHAPGGTPGAPNQGPTPTGTWQPGQGNGPPPNAGQPSGSGQQNIPGAQATAQAGKHGKPTVYRGTLSALDASSLTLMLVDGSSITIGLTPETRIKVPGPKAQGETLLVGMQVVVHSVADESGGPIARSVMAVPGKPSLTHRVGTVTAYAAGSSITILAVDGNSYTFALTADTKILPPGRAGTLAEDSRVTIIAPRDPAALGWTATGIVVHPPLP